MRSPYELDEIRPSQTAQKLKARDGHRPSRQHRASPTHLVALHLSGSRRRPADATLEPEVARKDPLPPTSIDKLNNFVGLFTTRLLTLQIDFLGM